MYLTQFLIWPLFLSNVHFKNRLCDLPFNQIMTLWKLLEGWMCLDARQNPQVFNYSHLIISFIIVQMGLKGFCHRWPIHPIPVNPIISYPLGLSAHPTLILSKLINIYLWCIIFYPVQILWALGNHDFHWVSVCEEIGHEKLSNDIFALKKVRCYGISFLLSTVEGSFDNLDTQLKYDTTLYKTTVFSSSFHINQNWPIYCIWEVPEKLK